MMIKIRIIITTIDNIMIPIIDPTILPKHPMFIALTGVDINFN
jgi:hypothetical protein